MTFPTTTPPQGSENRTFRFDLDAEPFNKAMKEVSAGTVKFGSVFSSTMKNAIKQGKGFEDTLKSMALRLSDMALSSALKPLDNLVSNGMQGLVNSFASGIGGGGFGGSPSGGMPVNITPFAKGGVVKAPNYFSFGERIGVMGERGSEAIMPLARGADGRLGIAANASSSGPTNITFNVASHDAEGFRKSEGQITAMLARAVARGQRKL